MGIEVITSNTSIKYGSSGLYTGMATTTIGDTGSYIDILVAPPSGIIKISPNRRSFYSPGVGAPPEITFNATSSGGGGTSMFVYVEVNGTAVQNGVIGVGTSYTLQLTESDFFLSNGGRLLYKIESRPGGTTINASITTNCVGIHWLALENSP